MTMRRRRPLRIALLALCLAIPSTGFLAPNRRIWTSSRTTRTSRLVASKKEIQAQQQEHQQDALPDLNAIFEESNQQRIRRQNQRRSSPRYNNANGDNRAYTKKSGDKKNDYRHQQQRQHHPFLPSLSDVFNGKEGIPSTDGDWEGIRGKLHPHRSFAAISAAQTRQRRVIQTLIPSQRNNGGRHERRQASSPGGKRSPPSSRNNDNKKQQLQASGEPWKAPYHISRQTQRRLQAVARHYYSRPAGKRAQAVLNELLHVIPHDRSNIANIVCALGISARCHTPSTQLPQPAFRNLFLEVMDHTLPIVQEAETVTTRQLCNAIWAVGKHVNKDPTLLPTADGGQYLRRDSWDVTREEWNLNDRFLLESSPEIVVGEFADEIAEQVTAILSQEQEESIPFHRKYPKLGEVCMTTWAYGILKRSQRSLGWHPSKEVLAGSSDQSPEGTANRRSSDDVLKFETWKQDSGDDSFSTWKGNADQIDDFEDNERDSQLEDLDVVGRLFEAIATYLTEEPWEEDWEEAEKHDHVVSISDTASDDDTNKNIRLQACTWNELANVGWAFACVGHGQTDKAEELVVALTNEATRRLRHRSEPHLPRDLSQLTWAVGTLQENNYRIGDSMVELMEEIANYWLGKEDEGGNSAFAEQDQPSARTGGTKMDWSNADLVQLANAMAHGRVDNRRLQRALYQEAFDRLNMDLDGNDQGALLGRRPDQRFQPWEVSILLWVQARMHLRGSMDPIFESFARQVPRWLLREKERLSVATLDEIGIGQQEQANLAWSLTVLENYEQPSSRKLLHAIFEEVSTYRLDDFLLEHAHQLWQAAFVLGNDCPEALRTLPSDFHNFLQRMWEVEKSRQKKSSMRHQTISNTLKMMGVAHSNEHDEDIDVAIVLKKPQGMGGKKRGAWTHEAEDSITSSAEDKKFRVAVEFDGPKHFTRGAFPRALGHTVLKYRLLKQQGWAVVRVPYYDWDRIPYWSSMEQQRYLQRLLKTHPNLKFSDVDVSEYKPVGSNRLSRFD